jgi:hypothetical protein
LEFKPHFRLKKCFNTLLGVCTLADLKGEGVAIASEKQATAAEAKT